jgi:hypothetical protein
MAVFGMGLAEVGGDLADLLGVGPRVPHALLRLAHLGGGHHFHGAGDLARVFHALDLGADFLAAAMLCSYPINKPRWT